MPSLHFQDIIVSDSGNTCKKLRKYNKSAVFFKREKCALMPDTSGIYGKRVFFQEAVAGQTQGDPKVIQCILLQHRKKVRITIPT